MGEHDDSSKKKSYKAFRTDIIAALSSFDRASDWADLIRYLQRLNDVLMRHKDAGSSIPEKLLLGKRLAQCLDSSFQPGVHLKALEAYRTIFARLGPVQLCRDIHVYSSGLFPLLSYGATTVKRALLGIYEDFFLEIGPSLVRALDGLILALLPGLEDETSDYYSQVVNLLHRFRVAVDDDASFAISAWRSLMFSPNRMPAIAFLNICYQGNLLQYPPAEIVAPAFAIALRDENHLVRRNTLDFLTKRTTPQGPELGEQRRQVVVEALRCVVKAEMSITKRVFSWLCGPEEGEVAEQYFRQNSAKVFIEALEEIFVEPVNTNSSRSYGTAMKIVQSIYIRQEILDSTYENLVWIALRRGLEARESSKNITPAKVDHWIDKLIHLVGPDRVLNTFLWKITSLNSIQDLVLLFKVLCFGLGYLSLQADEGSKNTTARLPIMISRVVDKFELLAKDNAGLEGGLSSCALMCTELEGITLSPEQRIELAEVQLRLARKFNEWLLTNVDEANSVLWSKFEETTPVDEEKHECELSSYTLQPGLASAVAQAGCSVLGSLSRICRTIPTTGLLAPVVKCTRAQDIRVCIAGVQTFTEIAKFLHGDADDGNKVSETIESVVFRCWRMFHPESTSCTLVAAKLWLELEKQFPTVLQGVMADGILSTERKRRSRNLERYLALWKLVAQHHLHGEALDGGLLLMLDALSDSEREHRMISRVWLTDALLIDPVMVFDVPLHLLLGPETATGGENFNYITYYDAPRALYAFQTLQTVVRRAEEISSQSQPGLLNLLGTAKPSAATAAALAALYASEAESDQDHAVRLGKLLPAPTFAHAMAVTALGFIRASVPDTLGESEDVDNFDNMKAGLGATSFRDQHAAVAASAAEFLATLLFAVKIPSRSSDQYAQCFADTVTKLLGKSINDRRFVLQLNLIDILEALLHAREKPFEYNGTGNKYRDGLAWTAAEASPSFLSTVTRGLILSARGSDHGADSTGLRRRWVSFICNTPHYLGDGLEPFMASSISSITQLVEDESILHEESSKSNEYQRVDDRSLLLLGLADLLKTALEQYSNFVEQKSKNAVPEFNEVSRDGHTEIENDSAVTDASESALGNMNPLKFLSDIRDMIVGGSGDQNRINIDPRQHSIHTVFTLLPRIVSACVHVWTSVTSDRDQQHSKEGLAAQRAAILKCFEPFLRQFPSDLLASFIAYWYKKRIRFPGTHWYDQETSKDVIWLLLAIPGSTPEAIATAICDVLDIALRWDEGSPLAQAGKNRRLQKESRAASTSNGTAAYLSHRESFTKQEITGGSTQDGQTTAAKTLLVASDFFAEFHADNIQTASLEFLSCFLESCKNRDDLTAAWPVLYASVREMFSTTIRPSVALETLNALASYVRAVENINTDKRYRKELAHVTGITAKPCVAIASGNANYGLPEGEDAKVDETKSRSASTGPGGISDGSEAIKKSHLIAKGMTANANSLVLVLNAAFVDELPGALAILNPAVDAAINVLKEAATKRAVTEPNEEVAKSSAAKLLVSCTRYEWSLKTIRKGVLALLESETFFNGKSSALLRTLAAAINAVLEADKNLMANIGTGGSGAGASGITAVFAGRDSEVNSRARAIRRISFCVFFGEPMQFSRQVSGVLEKLRDSLRLRSNRLTAETFLCLRVLLLRAGTGSIRQFRASTLSEVVRTLENPTADLEETVAVLQFLDLVYLLRVPDFAFEQCFFFATKRSKSSGSESDQQGNSSIVPLVNRLADSNQEGFKVDDFSYLRVDPALTICGGNLRDVSPNFLKAYATKLCERVILSNETPVEPELTTINFELEQEFHTGVV